MTYNTLSNLNRDTTDNSIQVMILYSTLCDVIPYGASSLDYSIALSTAIMEGLEATPEKLLKEETKISIPAIYLEQQNEGGFIAFSKEYPGAIGEGETREEAIRDLEEAIELLKEVLEEDKAMRGKRDR